jgi:hypothetical protein
LAQFAVVKATENQIKFHSVKEVIALTSSRSAGKRDNSKINKKILPYVIEWPFHKYYTCNGVFLQRPENWEIEIEDTYEDFDFKAKSPVKAFKPRK